MLGEGDLSTRPLNLSTCHGVTRNNFSRPIHHFLPLKLLFLDRHLLGLKILAICDSSPARVFIMLGACLGICPNNLSRPIHKGRTFWPALIRVNAFLSNIDQGIPNFCKALRYLVHICRYRALVSISGSKTTARRCLSQTLKS